MDRSFGGSSPVFADGCWRGVVLAVACALLLAGTGAGCARAGQATGWQVNRSRNVVLYTDAKKEHEFIQEWLELSHAAFQAFFPEVKTGAVEAVWLKNEPGAFTRFYTPNDDPRSGWTFETMPSGPIGRDGLIVLERRSEWRGMYFSGVRDETLAKEQMAHLFINKAIKLAPLWLQVGLGRYLQKFRIHYNKDFWLACFGSPVFDEPIRTAINRSGREVTLTVDQLLRDDWYDYDKRRRYWYEYTAYAFVHYLLHGGPGHRQRFEILLRALRDGQSTDDALATAYPHVLPDEWDERLQGYVRPPEGRARIAQNQYLPQGLCLRIPPAHHADKTPSKSPANSRDIQLLLSDLEQMDPFRRHSGWWPEEIVRAEAARRPGRGGRPGPGPERRTPATPGDKPAVSSPEADIPSIRVPVQPPPELPPD